MTPITFNGCFGWLHTGSGERGVVLCPPLGHEAVATHRGWRQLAESLAQQGLHVVRFDYHGTGDSEGDDSDPARAQVWQENIASAANFLREHCKVNALTLVGLRFGATLALLAAENIADVEAIVLLAPVISGRTHLRELRLLARIWHEQAFGKSPHSAQNDSLEVTGTRHSSETIRSLGSTDLRQIKVSAPRVLVMDTGERLETRQLAERLQTLGAEVDRLPFLGEAEFLTEPVTSRIPYDAFAHLAAWIGRSPAGGGDRPAVPQTFAGAVTFGHGTESPLRFGPNRRLFGILCRPFRSTSNVPVAIMVNTGRSRHTGDARFYVTLARQLAAEGIPSLRMDLSGLGDSDPDPRAGETMLHDVASCRDVSAAIDHLATMGWTEAALIGVCSGAFVAFQTALSDPRVRSIDLINQQRFLPRPQPTTDVAKASPSSPAAGRRPVSFYVKSLLSGYAWRAIFSGRVDVIGVLLGMLRPLLERYTRWLGRQYEMITGRQTRSGAAHRLFRQLSERHVRVRLWYGEADPGWPELESWFGRGGAGLQRFRGVDLTTIPEADHALQSGEARSRITSLLCREFQRHAPNTGSEMPVGKMAAE